ncbi:hypothetical protein R3P38DRAFT_2502729 [Favolaschia claudopus]|uniref:F-box domain-containing protein n=1 Tax=Favolaschia claudopus TaxID=2862362 RepID=A0AAW0DMU8_9AGAR
MQVSKLPQELLEEVVDNLDGDYRSLRACALASRSLVPRSRIHLFRTCRLSARKLIAFRDLLRSPKCTFISCIQNIEAYRASSDPNDHYFNEVAPDLHCLTYVRSLDVILNVLLTESNMEDYFLRGFFAAFPRIKRFKLLCGASETLPVPLVRTLCLFPALEVVKIIDTRYFGVEDAPIDASPPQGLFDLDLGMSTTAPILSWLYKSKHLPDVSTLKLGLVKSHEAQIVRRSLQQAGGALTSLVLELTWTPETYWAYTFSVFDLALHPNLTTLTVSDHSSLLDFDPNLMLQLIKQLNAPRLKQIFISLHSKQYGSDFEWGALDAFLSAPAQFPRLQTVAIKCNRGCFCNKLFRSYLPLLNAAGVLQTKW